LKEFLRYDGVHFDKRKSLSTSTSAKVHILPLMDDSELKLHCPRYSPPDETTLTVSPASGCPEIDLIAPEKIHG
jgi:hypothetical protein